MAKTEKELLIEFTEKNVGDINDTWDGIVKTVTKKYELR